MKKTLATAIGLGLLIGGVLTVSAQRQRQSPHETVAATLGGKKVTIEYGRPYMKGREIFGKLVPYGQVWRTGADEATVLTTEGDLMLGSLHVPAGSYSLFTIPAENEWTLIVNKTAKQWGAFKYDQGTDLGRVKMKVEKLSAPVEQFTITLDAQGSKGTLKLAWEKTAASIPVMMH
jgi:hypothetical protein